MMAFHIPFEHRNRNRQRLGPIYIGFDEPARKPRKKFNWWGFHGLWMSLASFVTAGFLSPVPLLISLVGLRRPGKKMATVGTLFSLLGVGLAATILTMGVANERHQDTMARLLKEEKVLKAELTENQSLMNSAKDELEEHRDSNAGELPSWVDCNMLMIKYEDPWGKSLRFDVESEEYGLLRSAGPDAQFDSGDDVTMRIEGETDRRVLLDLDLD